MEGQPFLLTIAGLGLSLAGFSSLVGVFRANSGWDPVALWRVRTIVRTSLDAVSAALVPVPVFYLTGSQDWAIRAGTALLLALSITSAIRRGPQKQPEAWPERYSVIIFYVINAVTFGLIVLNLVIANLGLLFLLLLWELGFPADIFSKVIEEFRPSNRLDQSTGGDSTDRAERS